MMNQITPIEYDAAFGNLLNDMMIAMENDAMDAEINLELQVIADEERLEEIEAVYNEMLDEMFREHEMATYAAHSYDQDTF